MYRWKTHCWFTAPIVNITINMINISVITEWVFNLPQEPKISIIWRHNLDSFNVKACMGSFGDCLKNVLKSNKMMIRINFTYSRLCFLSSKIHQRTRFICVVSFSCEAFCCDFISRSAETDFLLNEDTFGAPRSIWLIGTYEICLKDTSRMEHDINRPCNPICFSQRPAKEQPGW